MMFRESMEVNMIRGSIVALITPFKDNGDVDYRETLPS